jgi:tetratricopeptide (TPR) repeat protein
MVEILIHLQCRFRALPEKSSKAYSLAPWHQAVVGELAGLLMQSGDKLRAEGLLHKFAEDHSDAALYVFALFYVRCGEREKALDWIEKAIESRQSMVLNLLRDPRVQILQSSPRWPALMKTLNWPEASAL